MLPSLVFLFYEAASRCDLCGCDHLWISEQLIVFPGGGEDLYFIHMQGQVSAFRASWGFSLSLLMASSHAGGGEANPGRTTRNINAVLHHLFFPCTKAAPEKKATLTYSERYQRSHILYSVCALQIWIEVSERPGWRCRCDVAADGQQCRRNGQISRDRSSAHNYQTVRLDSGVPARSMTSNLRGSGPRCLLFSPHTSPLRSPHTLISARAERGYSLNQQSGRKCEKRQAGLHNWLWTEAEDSGGGGVSDWWRPALFRSVSLHSTPNKQWQTWITQVPVSLMMLYFIDFHFDPQLFLGSQSQG